MDIIAESLEVLNGTHDGWADGCSEKNFIEFWEMIANMNDNAFKMIPVDMQENPHIYSDLPEERKAQVINIFNKTAH